MDKNQIQDVVPPTQRRSIRDIPIPARGNRHNDIKNNHEQENDDFEQPPINNNLDNKEDSFDDFNEPPKGNKLKIFIIGLGFIIIAFILFITLSVFDKAIINITPKVESSSFDQQILIEELTERNNNDSLGYRIIELSQETNTVVEAIDEEEVQEKASGEITIFNSYSEDSQRLIKNTRFESSDGRIYRIEDSVEVPGFLQGADGEMVPGEITVTVYADEVGDEYNLQSGEFTIPGFEGQEPFDFFSAKTKTPITGGFDGVRKIVSENDIQEARTQLENELREKLIGELNDQVTDEFYVYYDDSSFIFNNIEQNDTGENDSVELVLRGKIEAKVFNKTDLSNSLAEILFNSYLKSENTRIENFDSIEIQYINDEQNNEYLEVVGESDFIWQIDRNQIKKDLVDKKETQFIEIMNDYTEIKKADLKISPFWRTTFPSNEKNIDVKITLEQE